MNSLINAATNLPGDLVAQALVTLLGIFVGTLAALATDRRNEQRKMRRRARVVLRSLLQEMGDNCKILQDVKASYSNTAWGRSFYLSTLTWETALSSGDLPDIIGFELADLIAAQYALFVRIRYYVDLLTRLWMAPSEIQGYEDIRRGFHKAIYEALNQALGQQTKTTERIKAHPSVQV